MFCCTLLYVHSSIAIILMGKRELIALLNLSSWCLVMVERLFLAVPRGCLRFVIVVFPDHCHLLFFRMGKTLQIFSETISPTAYRLTCSMKQYLVVFYICPANHAPGIQIGHALGVICSHRLIFKKTWKNSLKPGGIGSLSFNFPWVLCCYLKTEMTLQTLPPELLH